MVFRQKIFNCVGIDGQSVHKDRVVGGCWVLLVVLVAGVGKKLLGEFEI